jgi:hypothetical protein
MNMRTFLHTTRKLFGASLLAVFAIGNASAQDTIPARDTSATVTDPSGTANGGNGGALGNTNAGNAGTGATKPAGRELIHDRGTSSIGQYDPSGNSLPTERSPYERVGAAYYPPRPPKQKPAQREYRDYGGTVFRQPDPSGNGAPATPVPQQDPYVSNQPAAPTGGTTQNTFAPGDSTANGTSTTWGNSGEQKPADQAGTTKGQSSPANKTKAPADTTKQQRIKGWDY